jgi:hypothetical protein
MVLGFGWGWPVLAGTGTVLLFYLVIGMYYGYKVRVGRRESDAGLPGQRNLLSKFVRSHPHYRQWAQIAGLVVDGCRFITCSNRGGDEFTTWRDPNASSLLSGSLLDGDTPVETSRPSKKPSGTSKRSRRTAGASTERDLMPATVPASQPPEGVERRQGMMVSGGGSSSHNTAAITGPAQAPPPPSTQATLTQPAAAAAAARAASAATRPGAELDSHRSNYAAVPPPPPPPPLAERSAAGLRIEAFAGRAAGNTLPGFSGAPVRLTGGGAALLQPANLRPVKLPTVPKSDATLPPLPSVKSKGHQHRAGPRSKKKASRS